MEEDGVVVVAASDRSGGGPTGDATSTTCASTYAASADKLHLDVSGKGEVSFSFGRTKGDAVWGTVRTLSSCTNASSWIDSDPPFPTLP